MEGAPWREGGVHTWEIVSRWADGHRAPPVADILRRFWAVIWDSIYFVYILIDISNVRAAIPPVFRDTVTLRLYNRLCTRLEMLFYWTFFGTSEKVAITSQKLKISFLSPKFELCYLLENICQLEWSVPSSLDNKWYEKCLTSLIFSIFYLVKIFNIWPHQYFYFNLKVGSALNSEN